MQLGPEKALRHSHLPVTKLQRAFLPHFVHCYKKRGFGEGFWVDHVQKEENKN